MRRALVADLHVGQVPGDYARFSELVARLPAEGVGELILGGDVFRALVGLPRFWSPPVRQALGELARLREKGVRVVWVEGNRDFFLATKAMAPYLDRFVPAYGFSAAGRKFLVEHGDLINRRDRQYRIWRAVSKSRMAFWGATLIPKGIAQRLVTRTEQALARTNFSYRRALPEQDLISEARRHFACGVDVVFWGHFHRLWSFAEGKRRAFVVPPWQDDGAVVYIEADGSVAATRGDGQFVDMEERFCYQGQEAAR